MFLTFETLLFLRVAIATKGSSMFRFLRSAIPIAATMLFLAVQAKAATVSYYTTGSFSAGSNAGVVTPGSTATTAFVDVSNPSAPAGRLTFTFAGSAATPITKTLNSAGTVNVNAGGFGNFTVSDVSTANLDDFAGVQFTVNFFQTSPGSSTGSLVGQVTVTLEVVTGAGDNPQSTLRINFNPITVQAVPDGYFYTVDAQVVIGGDGTSTQLNGSIAAPLPGVAVGGIWLLGGLGSVGGLNALRRRFGLLAAA